MEHTFVCLDIETTGLSPIKDRIIEIGAVKVVNGEITDEFSEFINPLIRLPERIIELTGIRDEMLEDARTAGPVTADLMDFLGDCPILGHNILFDYSFLKVELGKQGREFQCMGIDTLKMSRILHEELESKALSGMCRYYNIDNKNAHRALDDAKAAYELYKKLKEEFFYARPEVFAAEPLIYHIKKQEPVTKAQKNYLIDLLKYHKIEFAQSWSTLTKSEASRIIDKIILEYGRIR